MAQVKSSTTPKPGDRVEITTVRYGQRRGVVESVSLNGRTYCVTILGKRRADVPEQILVTGRQIALVR